MRSLGPSLACCILVSSAVAAVSYSNMATRVGTVHPLIAAGQAAGLETGNTVTLGGPQRLVTRVDVALRIGGAGVAQCTGRLRLYANDGPLGAPGTLLFTGVPRSLILDSGADITHQFPVSSVRVPESFTWTIELSGRTGNQAVLGSSHYDPPTVGAADPGYWVNNGGWTLGAGTPPFGARVVTEHLCSSDFNGDGAHGQDDDIEAFFLCLGGNCCGSCLTADFNGDGAHGQDDDIESFFLVLGGGACM